MNQYLHLRCGAVECLLDIDCVQEVGEQAEHEDAGEHGLWRGLTLPATNLGILFGQHDQSAHWIVIQEQNGLRLLLVDAVLGLITAAPEAFQSFATVTETAQRCFDQALPQSDGRCLLRLRLPLDWL